MTVVGASVHLLCVATGASMAFPFTVACYVKGIEGCVVQDEKSTTLTWNVSFLGQYDAAKYLQCFFVTDQHDISEMCLNLFYFINLLSIPTNYCKIPRNSHGKFATLKILGILRVGEYMKH